MLPHVACNNSKLLRTDDNVANLGCLHIIFILDTVCTENSNGGRLCIRFNQCMPSGLFYLNSLDLSISNKECLVSFYSYHVL